MLSLTDAQLDCVFAAAEPLDVNDRDLFLRDVARALDGQVLGDGTVARTCREIQRRYFRPPLDTESDRLSLRTERSLMVPG